MEPTGGKHSEFTKLLLLGLYSVLLSPRVHGHDFGDYNIFCELFLQCFSNTFLMIKSKCLPGGLFSEHPDRPPPPHFSRLAQVPLIPKTLVHK